MVKNLEDHGRILRYNIFETENKQEECKAAKAAMQARVSIKRLLNKLKI